MNDKNEEFIEKEAPNLHAAIVDTARKNLESTQEFCQRLMPIFEELSTLHIFPDEIRILAEALKNILGNMLQTYQVALYWSEQFELHSMQLLILEDKFQKGEEIH